MVPRVLIVDDNMDFRTMIKDYLKASKLNVDIYEAATGELGIAKASFVKADIVLMDISLPNANGIDSAKCIKEDNPGCDVIILTMFEVDAFRKIAYKIQARDFIGKSEIYDKLIPALKKCLKERESVHTK